MGGIRMSLIYVYSNTSKQYPKYTLGSALTDQNIKNRGFWMFSGDMEMGHWFEID